MDRIAVASDAASVPAAHLTPQCTLQATVSVATPLMSRQLKRDRRGPETRWPTDSGARYEY